MANPRVMVKFQTDRMRIDGENYEYHEQTKQTSQLSISLQIIANSEYTIGAVSMLTFNAAKLLIRFFVTEKVARSKTI